MEVTEVIGEADIGDYHENWSEEEEEFDELPQVDQDFVDDNTKQTEVGRVPFSTVHQDPLPFDCNDRRCFIPGQPINVEILCTENHRQTKMLNPNLYVIKLTHGDHSWVIKKRFKHLSHLHDQLTLYRARNRLPIPMKTYREKRRSFAAKRNQMPKFPRVPDALVRQDQMESRKEILQHYLETILRSPQYRNHHETVKFLEVSHLSFVHGLEPKLSEGMVNKRSGDREVSTGCCSCWTRCVKSATAHWNKRYLVCKDTYLAYIHPEKGTISDILLMDRDFEISSGILRTGYKDGIIMSNLSRKLQIRTWTQRKCTEWKKQISEVSKSGAGKEFIDDKRYDSFAPERPEARVLWYVDAAGYLSDCADAMEFAKEEIFITDWWLSPEIYMKRPMTDGEKWRLDMILKRKADEGVKIFVMLFKEMEMALGINSFYTKAALLKLHPTNIKVMRHPDGINLWSHHEKCVVIDQSIAFIGGIDLCYGRWDTPAHRLTDVGPAYQPPQPGEDRGIPLAITLTSLPFMPMGGNFFPQMLPNSQGKQVEKSPDESKVVANGAKKVDIERSVSSPATTGEFDHHMDQQQPALSTVPEQHQSHTGLDEVDQTKSESKNSTHIGESSDSDIVTTDNIDSENHINSSTVITNGEQSTADVTADDEQLTERQNEPGEHSSTKGVRQTMMAKRVVSLMLEGVTKESSQVERGEDNPVFQMSPVTTPIEELSRSLNSNALNVNDVNENQIQVQLHTPDDDRESVNSFILAPNDSMLQAPTSTDGDITPASYLTAPEEPDPSVAMRGKRTSVSKSKLDKESRERVKRAKVKLKAMWKFVDETESAATLASQNADKQNSSEQLSKKRGKRPTLLRGLSVREKSEEADVVLNPSLLDSPDGRNNYLDMLNNIKPTTPKARRKLMERAHGMTVDFKQRFRKKQSKSVEGGKSIENLETEFSFTNIVNELPPNPEADMYDEYNIDVTSRLWVGKDYTNFIAKDFVDLDKPFTDFIDRRETPRMPWHDIAGVVYGKPARDVARHFIQRWNFTKLEKRKTHAGYPILVPKSYNKFHIPRFVKNKVFTADVQVLRSSCDWSAGIQEKDDSIHQAYVDLIKNSKHYIYIENQFFVSIHNHDVVKNQISNALFERILKAHKEKAPFRVYVIMPLLPAFEGEVGTTGGSAIQAVTHWNYSSICRGGKSLLERLTAKKVDPINFITFYGLRKHEKLIGQMTSELIYVHSKLMIVDDTSVIMGSANINDRSMIGHRDSELAILVQDTKFTESRMNGQPYQSGWFAGSLRKALFREHLGVDLKNPIIDVTDPVISEFYRDTWVHHASINTTVYDKVFNAIPTDKVRTFQQLNNLKRIVPLIKTNKDEALKQLEKVQGHLVLLPLMFLCDENLMPQMGTKEALAPTIIWT